MSSGASRMFWATPRILVCTVEASQGGRGFTRSSRPRGTLFSSLSKAALGSGLTREPVNSTREPWGDGFGVWRGRALPFLAARSAANCFMAEFIAPQLSD